MPQTHSQVEFKIVSKRTIAVEGLGKSFGKANSFEVTYYSWFGAFGEYRMCCRCFTKHEVKVDGGNNRQFDLLAVSLLNEDRFHVESSVTHCENWCPDADGLIQEFERKFFGVPAKRDEANTDYSKGKNYVSQIEKMYKKLGQVINK